jgi:hypothetical protein
MPELRTSSRAQTSQTTAPCERVPSEATTRIVPGRTPQTAQVAPAVAYGESLKDGKACAPGEEES